MSDVLNNRALNRATLARQLLLDRAERSLLDAIAHLCGIQAQEPQEPYVALWTRLRAFDAHALSNLIVDRQVVRTHLMRRTIHLMTTTDTLAWRARHEAMLRQRVLGSYRRALTGVNLDELAAAGSQVMSDGLARTTSELARAVADRWPDTDPQALGAVLIPGYVRAVQIPPRGLWRTPGAAKYALLSDWVHARVTAPNEDPTDPVGQAVILRYLEAFGPAAVSDIRAWSGLTRLDIPVAALRERLVSFHDERGRELLDLPDAPRPDVDVTAPVRFLPAFDNAMLGYDNRDRIVDDEHRHVSVDGHRVVLVDGRVAATWAVHDTVLEVSPFQKLRRAARSELTVEGHALAHFLSDGAHDRVRIH